MKSWNLDSFPQKKLTENTEICTVHVVFLSVVHDLRSFVAKFMYGGGVGDEKHFPPPSRILVIPRKIFKGKAAKK